MRTLIFVFTLLIFAPACFAAADDPMSSMSMPTTAPKSGSSSAQVLSKEPVYICPMHPHIHGKKGDICPICGMELVPQEEQDSEPEEIEDKKQSSSEDMGRDRSGALEIKPVYRQALGIKTASVSEHNFGRSITASGIIAPQTRGEYVVAVRAGGWITDLKADAVGDVVKKGDLLFTFYSPDLLSAQSDYIVAKRGGSVVGFPDQRLRLYGMDDKAISELNKKGKFLEQTPFYAPADGTVTSLNVRKGAYVDPQMGGGTTIMTLQDFTHLWVIAQVPIKDLQFLSPDTPATVKIDETGNVLPARIETILPTTEEESRYGMVRLVLDNPDGALKSGSIANVMFEADSQKRLAVPEEAVLYDGKGGHVIESLGEGYFRPVMVKTGITANGLTEITSGLKAGQNIVTSGQFMIDAESNLRGGMDQMGGMDMSDMNAGDAHGH